MESVDEVIAIRAGANGKPLSDFEDACEKFKKAHRRFEHWDQQPDRHTDKWTRLEWWDSLHKLSDAERRVEKIFMGVSEPTQKCRIQYALFRELFLEGKPMKPNS